jgi:hypothetical protein
VAARCRQNEPEDLSLRQVIFDPPGERSIAESGLQRMLLCVGSADCQRDVAKRGHPLIVRRRRPASRSSTTSTITDVSPSSTRSWAAIIQQSIARVLHPDCPPLLTNPLTEGPRSARRGRDAVPHEIRGYARWCPGPRRPQPRTAAGRIGSVSGAAPLSRRQLIAQDVALPAHLAEPATTEDPP